MDTFILSEAEKEVIRVVRKLKPYGKVEFALNQNGRDITWTLNNPERAVIVLLDN